MLKSAFVQHKLPFSSITLLTRDCVNPIAMKDDLKLLPDELATFS